MDSRDKKTSSPGEKDTGFAVEDRGGRTLQHVALPRDCLEAQLVLSFGGLGAILPEAEGWTR